MRPIRIGIFILTVCAMLMVLPATTARADVDPFQAPYADANTHMIPANASQWYRFVYSGDNSVLTIRMPEGVTKRLGFQIYTPEQMKTWWDTAAIGMGSPEKDDLVWAGRFPLGGTYGIEVRNDTAAPLTFTLQFTGKAASFTPPGTVPTAVTSPVELPIANMDPMKALPVAQAKGQTIPPNTTLWYSFSYAGDRSQALITLVNGNKNHLLMHVHTPGQMLTWWDTSSIGQGNPKNDNLIWSGNAHVGGTWYVEVVNVTPQAVGFDLTVEGKGLWY